jgi:hypothetical protein
VDVRSTRFEAANKEFNKVLALSFLQLQKITDSYDLAMNLNFCVFQGLLMLSLPSLFRGLMERFMMWKSKDEGNCSID